MASILVSFIGTLVALMGGIMWFELAGGSDVGTFGAAAMLWFGLAAVIHGTAIRRHRKLMHRPRWTYIAFLFGIASIAALDKSIWERDVVAVICLLPMQLFALFALWHSTWRHAPDA